MRLATLALVVMLVTSAGAAGVQPRVVLVDIDGIRRDTLEAAYLSGKLPNLERILGEVHEGKGFGASLWFEKATAVFPAITMAGQASLFTGVAPSRHGIPGNQWFERRTNRVIDYFSSTGMPCVYGVLPISLGECSGGLANRHLHAPTVYEAATAAGKTSTVVFSQYWKGATHAVLPTVSDAAYLLRGNAVDYRRFDETMIDRALESLSKDGWPDLLTVYFIGADGVGHHGGTRAQAAYLERVFDVQMGRLIDALGKAHPGWRENTQFILTSDHGRTDTKAAAGDASLEANIRGVLERGGYGAEQCKIVGNGGVVHVYLRSKTIGARWMEQPAAKEVEAAAKILADDGTLGKVVERVAARKNGVGYGYTTIGEERPDAGRITRLLAALESPQSGDVLLLLKHGRYFANNEADGAPHGSIFADDLAIPLVIAQGGAAPGRSAAPISTLEISRIIAAYLGFSMDAESVSAPKRR